MRDKLFFLHRVGRLAVLWGWLISPTALLLQAAIAVHWYSNSNRCIVSEWEIAYFGETFQGKRDARIGVRERVCLAAHACAGSMYWMLLA